MVLCMEMFEDTFVNLCKSSLNENEDRTIVVLIGNMLFHQEWHQFSYFIIAI